MDQVLDVVLSTEVIAGILIVAAMAMAVRSILFFTREASQMGPRVQKLDTDLSKYRDGMGSKKKVVKELTEVVDPLREREGNLRGYYDQLRGIELKAEKEQESASEDEEAARKKRVQRKKMGFD